MLLMVLRCLNILLRFSDVHPRRPAAPAVKNLRLAAFGPRHVTPTDSCVRVYVVDDTRAALDVSDTEVSRSRA